MGQFILTVLRTPTSHVRLSLGSIRAGQDFRYRICQRASRCAPLGRPSLGGRFRTRRGDNSMKPIRSLVAGLVPLVVLTALFIAAPFHEAWAQVAPPLGTTKSVAVLGASAVTNTGPSV